jgi:hypothetical protein
LKVGPKGAIGKYYGSAPSFEPPLSTLYFRRSAATGSMAPELLWGSVFQHGADPSRLSQCYLPIKQ